MNIGNFEFSNKLPEFTKTRQGTEIFILNNDKRISIYDDYSIYPEADATKWCVKVYDYTSGFLCDKICMCRGIYPTRERALYEIDRFKWRGNNLIFYVIPINFTYNKIKFIWSNESIEYSNEIIIATPNEQLEEAQKRLYCITGKISNKEIDILKNYKNRFGEQAIKAFYRTSTVQKYRFFPYAMLEFGNILYVSSNKSLWDYERYGLNKNYKNEYDGYAPAYVYDYNNPYWSEFGDIFFKYKYRKIYRVA